MQSLLTSFEIEMAHHTRSSYGARRRSGTSRGSTRAPPGATGSHDQAGSNSPLCWWRICWVPRPRPAS